MDPSMKRYTDADPRERGLTDKYDKSDKPRFTPRNAPRPAWMRPRRRVKLIALASLACLAFIALAQWTQLASRRTPVLSSDRLRQDVETCQQLRQKPIDPIGLGRERNARYIDGQKPTLIRNATLWVGEAVEGTSPEDDRNGKGYAWTRGDVFIQYGLIQKVEEHISSASLPKDTLTWDAGGRQLTSGIIDMHSHAGVGALPELAGTEDVNEMSGDVTPYVRSIDALNPLDPQLQVIKSGGVTTSLVLPGSGNNIGGEAFVIKHAVGTSDGRLEISAQDMLADPEAAWRYMKMACGENPKRVYGKVGRGPFSRMGESWEFRKALTAAASLVRQQDDWCDAAEQYGAEAMDSYLPQDLQWESLGAVLRGQVHVNTHCYTIPDLEAFVDHTNEFRFPLRAFHHAHQTFLVPEILKRAWGGRPPASALFADNMYYKAEADIASVHAGKILWEQGLTPVYVSDNPVLNAQHVVFEVAKAYRYGLPYHAALAGVTSAPAELLGLGNRLGKIKAGFDADLVLWDSDPLSVGAAPVQVWIDGFAQYEDPVDLGKPVAKPIEPTVFDTRDEAISVDNVVFTGITRVLLSDHDKKSASPSNVVITNGEITCVGSCAEEMNQASSSHKKVDLTNGYLTNSFTAFGSLIGLNAIDAEKDTDNGPSSSTFSRGIDGLALDTKKLHAAHRYGVTKAISAPKFTGGFTHHGTSVGFRTDAQHALEKGAVWSSDVAVHYTLTTAAKRGDTPSLSAALGSLRKTLLDAISVNETEVSQYEEKFFLSQVVHGKKPLVLTVHSADTITAILRVKSEVENALSASSLSKSKIRMVILGGAEAHLVARELADAHVGVVLAPFQSYAGTWDQRRALTGAPLTNGTAIDALLSAGVVTAIGLEEDWLVRDLGLHAGIAFHNGRGKLSEKEALALVSSNIYKMLGIEEPREGHFVVYEGSPLDIDGQVRAVGGGRGDVVLFD